MHPRAVVALAVIALLWVIGARVGGPSDAWDQTQPKTLAYTTDIVVRGNWILPTARGEPATKPPLYNWLAAPAVHAAGTSSELAHKMPSVVALLAAWLAMACLAPRVLGGQDRRVGWLAAAILVANYTIFKLGYLARPDMLLTLCTLLAWLAGSALLAGDRARWLAPAFWVCVGLGALAKGPAILPVILWAALAPWAVGRRAGALRAFGWWWGLPLTIVMAGAWVLAAWRVDAAHVWERLWLEEVLGRVTGTGPYGAEEGTIELLTSAPDMAWYWVSRFFPWCLAAVAAVVVLWRRGPDGGRRWHGLGREGAVLHAAALLIIVIIAAFTLSAGKRADYVAGAYPPGALLAAWWLCRTPRRTWLAAAGVVLVLLGLTLYNRRDPIAPVPGFGDAVHDFVLAVEPHLESDSAPLLFWVAGATHLQPMLGHAGPEGGGGGVTRAAQRGEPFWIIAGRREHETFEQWLAARPFRLETTEVERSAALPWTGSDPFQLVLYKAQGRP